MEMTKQFLKKEKQIQRTDFKAYHETMIMKTI